MSKSILAAGTALLGGIINKSGFDAQAERQRQAGIANLARIKRDARTSEGAMMVYFGKSGVTMEGSPMDAIGQNAYNAAMDEYMSNFNTESAVAASKQQGKAALISGIIQAAGSMSGDGASKGKGKGK